MLKTCDSIEPSVDWKASNTVKKYAFTLALTLGLGLLTVQKAEAITFTYSERTKEVSPFIELKGDYDLPFNINLAGGVGLAPNLSGFVLPVEESQVNNSDPLSQIKSLISWDVLADVNANLGYNFNLFDVNMGVGNLTGVITPYAGYRHMFTFTGQLDNENVNTQTQGINYGGKFKVGLPLGFSGYGFVEGTSLIGGTFERGSDSQPIQTNGMILPSFGAGVAWKLPVVNLANIYLGYKGFYLPRDLRIAPNYSPNTELVHGISAGFNVLFFGV